MRLPVRQGLHEMCFSADGRFALDAARHRRCAARRMAHTRQRPGPGLLPAVGARGRRVEFRLSTGMDSATPDTGPKPPEADILVCLEEAIARALHEEFQPRTFIDDFSTALQPVVPHDRLGIAYLGDNRRTFSVFATHGAPAFLPETDRHTTDLQRAQRFPVADSPLAEVFDGNVLCASDLLTDPRFVRHHEQLQTAGLRSVIVVPLLLGSRVIGALTAMSRVANAYGPVGVNRMRTAGRLIGPLIEAIVQVYRERRRQHRTGLLEGITQMLGTSLDLRQILEPVGDAVRVVMEFDAMGVVLFKPGGREYEFFGAVGEPPPPGLDKIPLSEFSPAAPVAAGRIVFF